MQAEDVTQQDVKRGGDAQTCLSTARRWVILENLSTTHDGVVSLSLQQLVMFTMMVVSPTTRSRDRLYTAGCQKGPFLAAAVARTLPHPWPQP
jgi:hypothetical protein